MAKPEEKVNANNVTFRVKDTGGNMYFTVKNTTQMDEIFSAYATRRGITISYATAIIFRMICFKSRSRRFGRPFYA